MIRYFTLLKFKFKIFKKLMRLRLHHFNAETFLLSTIMKNIKKVSLMKNFPDKLTSTQSNHKK